MNRCLLNIVYPSRPSGNVNAFKAMNGSECSTVAVVVAVGSALLLLYCCSATIRMCE